MTSRASMVSRSSSTCRPRSPPPGVPVKADPRSGLRQPGALPPEELPDPERHRLRRKRGLDPERRHLRCAGGPRGRPHGGLQPGHRGGGRRRDGTKPPLLHPRLRRQSRRIPGGRTPHGGSASTSTSPTRVTWRPAGSAPRPAAEGTSGGRSASTSSAVDRASRSPESPVTAFFTRQQACASLLPSGPPDTFFKRWKVLVSWARLGLGRVIVAVR